MSVKSKKRKSKQKSSSSNKKKPAKNNNEGKKDRITEFEAAIRQKLQKPIQDIEEVKGEVKEEFKEDKQQDNTEVNNQDNVSDLVSMREKLRKDIEKIKEYETKSTKQDTSEKYIIEEEPTEYVKSGIPGFDKLFEKGMSKGATVIFAGGAGSGKTIFGLQTLNYHASNGKKCFYMSFEESEEKLKQHMKDFGWDAGKLIEDGSLMIERYSPFDITRSVDAMLAKEKGELFIDIDPIIIPKEFKPDFIVLDSLTAIASAFTGKEDSYRIYIEQLFRFFEKLGSTSFLITETKQIPEIFSTTGVEEFLADGVIVFYNLKHGNVRENAIEVLKMRGQKHQKKIVAMRITNKGIEVFPEQEIFGGIGDSP